jgi:predicted aminopeptidase
MKSAIKFSGRVAEFLLMAIIVLAASNIRLVSYGFAQLQGQLNIVWNAKPIEDVIGDGSVPDSLREKLILVGEIKKFAVDSLGLKLSNNYTTLYDQKGKPVLWVLTAAEKYKLKSYHWKFPLIGTVEYKGFFDYDKGKKEEKKLSGEGYDTDYNTTSAWSTLGWFRDPILSNILYRNEGQVADLIIHEMTHATLYVKSSVDFNENLASAIGEMGAEQFLKFKYGDSSEVLTRYRNYRDDYISFASHMLRGIEKLDSVYKTFSSTDDERYKLERKTSEIKKIVFTLDTVSFYNKARYMKIFSQALPNNAYFLSFRRYDAQKEEMKKELMEKFHGNINSYLNYLKNKYK